VALDVATEDERREDLTSFSSTGEGELEWRLHPGQVLNPGDRVVVAATRRGLGALLSAGAGTTRSPIPGTGEHRVADAVFTRS
ncbi:potassium transporter TrkA, partial [Streptomyces daliensis]|nr:potassium transporter TrkA [Streptomyces daliensis]